MLRIPTIAAAALSLGLTAAQTAGAEEKTPAQFFAGNTVTIIVSSGAGGENGLYGRTMGDFLAGHIPGSPKIIMQYMPGGGGVKAANFCYNVAPKDGTILCHMQYSLPQAQLLGFPGIKYDYGKFSILGRSASTNSAIFVWHTVPVKTLADAREHEVIIPAPGRSADSFTDPTLINMVWGTKFKVIVGYKGGGDMDLALERGEVSGDAGPAVSVFTRHKDWVEGKKIRFLAQSGTARHPLLPNVPLLTELAENAEQKAIFTFLSARAGIGRTLLGPPGIPADRLAALRKAYWETVTDPAYVKEARRRGLDVIPATHTEVEKMVQATLATPPAIVTKVKTALGIRH